LPDKYQVITSARLKPLYQDIKDYLGDNHELNNNKNNYQSQTVLD
jgi:hypothetical protein